MATEGPLARRTVALPETRMLDVLAGLLERRGAHIWRCPMVAIFDHPDEAAVVRWMQAFIADPPALTILLTGEGLRRLLGVAERRGLTQAFHEALAQQPFLVRGPKPARVLRSWDSSRAGAPSRRPRRASSRHCTVCNWRGAASVCSSMARTQPRAHRSLARGRRHAPTRGTLRVRREIGRRPGGVPDPRTG